MLRTRFVTTIRNSPIIRYLPLILALAMIALPTKADRSTGAAAATEIVRGAAGCNGASFAEPVGSPVGAGFGPESVAVSDFNLDGRPDLAVANFFSNNVTVRIGNGSGGFTEAAGSPVLAGTAPDSVAIGDFNLDGKPDLVVANQNSNNVTILLGNGNGGFSEPAGSPVGAGDQPVFVAVGDFNLDGKPDIAAANINSNNLTILLGNGSGGFTEAAGSPVGAGTFPTSAAVGDFNLDGRPDVAVANNLFLGGAVTILLGNGSGGFTQAAGSPVGTGINPFSIAVGHFNQDGKLDLALANNGSNNVTILLGNGGGGFTEAAGSPVGAGAFPGSVAIADFNLDGKSDLAVANEGSDDVTILFGNGSGGFTEPAGSPVGVGVTPRYVGIGDFNLDGKSDLAVANFDDSNVTILLNTCDAFPCSGVGFIQPAGSPVSSGNGPISVSVGDFNRDGKPDLAMANYDSDNTTIVLGNGSGGFSQSAGSPVAAGSNPSCIAGGDFNLDGKPDLAVTNFNSDNVTILLGNGSGGFTQPAGSPVGVGGDPNSVAIGDFNLDGKPDLAAANEHTHNVTILLGNGSGAFTQAAGSPVGAGNQPASVAVADFNHDGKPDLGVANEVSNNVTILLGNGSGGFTEPPGSPFNAGDLPFSIAAGDFNLDGKPDLAVANINSNNMTILLGDGNGGFSEPAGSPVPAGVDPTFVAVGDFNLDGKPDLAATNLSSNNVTVQLNTCGGNTAPSACLQDETNGNFMSFDSKTGDYIFTVCSQNMQVSGRGTITRSADGCTITLTHVGPNKKTVKASINTCNNTGQATLTVVANRRVNIFPIKDLDTTNNTCACK